MISCRFVVSGSRQESKDKNRTALRLESDAAWSVHVSATTGVVVLLPLLSSLAFSTQDHQDRFHRLSIGNSDRARLIAVPDVAYDPEKRFATMFAGSKQAVCEIFNTFAAQSCLKVIGSESLPIFQLPALVSVVDNTDLSIGEFAVIGLFPSPNVIRTAHVGQLVKAVCRAKDSEEVKLFDLGQLQPALSDEPCQWAAAAYESFVSGLSTKPDAEAEQQEFVKAAAVKTAELAKGRRTSLRSRPSAAVPPRATPALDHTPRSNKKGKGIKSTEPCSLACRKTLTRTQNSRDEWKAKCKASQEKLRETQIQKGVLEKEIAQLKLAARMKQHELDHFKRTLDAESESTRPTVRSRGDNNDGKPEGLEALLAAAIAGQTSVPPTISGVSPQDLIDILKVVMQPSRAPTSVQLVQQPVPMQIGAPFYPAPSQPNQFPPSPASQNVDLTSALTTLINNIGRGIQQQQ